MRRLAPIATLAALVALPSPAPAERPASAAAVTYIFCANKRGDLYVRKHRPAKCAVFGPGGINAGGVNLKKIKWTKYTGREARGTAIECSMHLPCLNARATIHAYRVRAPHGNRVYTRMRATTKYGTTVVHLATYRRRTY